MSPSLSLAGTTDRRRAGIFQRQRTILLAAGVAAKHARELPMPNSLHAWTRSRVRAYYTYTRRVRKIRSLREIRWPPGDLCGPRRVVFFASPLISLGPRARAGIFRARTRVFLLRAFNFALAGVLRRAKRECVGSKGRGGGSLLFLGLSVEQRESVWSFIDLHGYLALSVNVYSIEDSFFFECKGP